MSAKRLEFVKNDMGDYTSALFPNFRIIGQCGENRSGGKARIVQYYLETPSNVKTRRHFSTLKEVFEYLVALHVID